MVGADSDEHHTRDGLALYLFDAASGDRVDEDLIATAGLHHLQQMAEISERPIDVFPER